MSSRLFDWAQRTTITSPTGYALAVGYAMAVRRWMAFAAVKLYNEQEKPWENHLNLPRLLKSWGSASVASSRDGLNDIRSTLKIDMNVEG